MDLSNINTNRDTTSLGPIDYDQTKVPAYIRKHANYVRTKTYGQDVREAQARNAEYAGLVANEAVDISNTTNVRQNELENTFNSLAQEITDKDIISAPEIIAARGGLPQLKDRLDATDAQLAQTDEHLKEVTGINVKYPPNGLDGAKGDNNTDDTEALTNIINYAINNLPAQLYFPKGIYLTKELPDLGYGGLSIVGESSANTVIKSISTEPNHIVLNIDAFGRSPNVALPFASQCNVRDILVQGNIHTKDIIYVNGISLSTWKNVTVKYANPTNGAGFNFGSAQLSSFYDLMCSGNLHQEMKTNGLMPRYGMTFTEGKRVERVMGNTANTFTNTILEAMPIGLEMKNCGSTTFIGGTQEANTEYGVYIGKAQRQNTFIGVGWESDSAIADFYDGGYNTLILNSYTGKSIVMAGQGGRLIGGFYQYVDIRPGAVKNKIDGSRIAYRGALMEPRGINDEGLGTTFERVLDGRVSKFVAPTKLPTRFAVGASPFTYTNDREEAIELIIEGGSVTDLKFIRGEESEDTPPSTTFTLPTNSTKILLSPYDKVKVTYDSAPYMYYLTHRGLMG